MEQEFELETEFIPLISLLKLLGIAETGGHAKLMVSDGEVKCNGDVELRKRYKVKKGDIIQVWDQVIKVV